MNRASIMQAWGQILSGYRPNLSIEITRECPLKCPGCYAFGDDHLGGGVVLRDLADLKGQPLIDGILGAVARHRPIHLSLVGGEPLVRFRELDALLPQLAAIDALHTQVVTSAVRRIPPAWAALPRLQVCVSVDGLQPEHDARRAPATYDRILKHIAGQHVTIHCTITRQQTRPGYVTAFADFWSARPEVEKIWFSLYTPQRGEQSPERLEPADRARVIGEIAAAYERLPTLRDMRPQLLAAYLHPPATPADCIFARSTTCLSADLERVIAPCQFGGDPECSSCGCMATAALDAVGRYRVGGMLPVRSILTASLAVGAGVRRMRRA